MKILYPIQKKHSNHLLTLLRQLRSALDASATGTGKTIVAAQIAKELGLPVLVVGLKSTLSWWKQCLKEQGVKSFDVINYELLRRGKSIFGKWQNGMWVWSLPVDTLIIWDECQRCQGLTTQNARMMLAAKPYYNLACSATAAENPAEMRALGYLLGLHQLKNFWAWAKARGCTPNQWGKLEFYGKKDIIEQLHKEIFPAHGSRIRVADMSDHFTETQIITTPLEFGKEIEEIYKQMEEEIENLKEVMLSDSKNPHAQELIAQLRARQKVELLKIPLIVEMAEDLLAEGRSVVVFLNYDDSIEAFKKHYKHPIGIIRGGQKDRDSVVEQFQKDTLRTLVCNIGAGGVSLNLHDINGTYPRTSIISPSWNPKEVLQAIGRIHRAGGATPTQQHILFAANTVEEAVEKAVRLGMERIEIFNDGMQKSVAIQKPICDNVKTVEEKQHAKYSPSNMGMFEKCPGYRNRMSKNAISERGDRIHDALEKDTIDQLPEEERNIAQPCKDYIDAVILGYLPTKPDVDIREYRITVDLGDGLSTFGTFDRFLLYGNKGHMYDFKSGYLKVTDAEENRQGWTYVLGLFQKYPQMESCEVTFLIPNRDEVSSHTFTRADIPRLKLTINTIVRRAMEVEDMGFFKAHPELLNPQPELCEYCSRQTTCPALAAKHLTILKKISGGLPVPSDLQVDKSRPQDIAHLMRLAPLMEEFAANIRSEALKVNLEEGIDIPGYNRFERSLPRSVSSVLETWQVVKDHYGDKISLEDFLAKCGTVSVPQLEDLLAEKAKHGEKGKIREEFMNELRAADVLNEGGKIFYLRENKK